MRVVVAGGHGKVARELERLLAARGDRAVGLVRNPAHVGDLEALGATAVVLDLESAPVEAVAEVLQDADAVVFAAGAGPGSGAARKDSVDRGAAVLLADAAQAAGVRRYLLLSSMGVDAARDGDVPPGTDEVFVAYLRAKAAAEDDLLTTDRGLDVTVLRPGGLTDDPPTGAVRLAASVPRGSVPRADVAAVLLALLDAPAAGGLVLEVVGGSEPVTQAVRGAVG